MVFRNGRAKLVSLGLAVIFASGFCSSVLAEQNEDGADYMAQQDSSVVASSDVSSQPIEEPAEPTEQDPTQGDDSSSKDETPLPPEQTKPEDNQLPSPIDDIYTEKPPAVPEEAPAALGDAPRLENLMGNTIFTTGEEIQLLAGLTGQAGEYRYGWYNIQGEPVAEGSFYYEWQMPVPAETVVFDEAGEHLLIFRAWLANGQGKVAEMPVTLSVMELSLTFVYRYGEEAAAAAGAFETTVVYQMNPDGRQGKFQFKGLATKIYNSNSGLEPGNYHVKVYAPYGFTAKVNKPTVILQPTQNRNGVWTCEARVIVTIEKAQTDSFYDFAWQNRGGGK